MAKDDLVVARVDKGLKAKLDLICNTKRITTSEAVRRALESWVEEEFFKSKLYEKLKRWFIEEGT